MISREDLTKRAENLEKYHTQHEKALELLMDDLKIAFKDTPDAGELMCTHILINNACNLLALIGRSLSKYENLTIEGSTSIILDLITPIYNNAAKFNNDFLEIIKKAQENEEGFHLYLYF